MLTLAATETLRGVAGSGSAITYTITGDEKTTANAFKVLAQGQLPAVGGTLYTAPGSTGTLVQKIFMANTTAGAVTAGLYVNGTAGTNLIFACTIEANGSAIFAHDGWKTYDAAGKQLFVGSTGAQGIQGIQGEKGWSPILAVVNDGARRVFQITSWVGGAGTPPSSTNQFIGAVGIVGTAAAAVDIRGAAGADAIAFLSVTGNTGTATADSNADSLSIVGAGVISTAATDNPEVITISSAALTGDVTTSGAAATLATVNANVGTFGSTTQSAVVTVNAKGLVTAASNVTINALTGWVDITRQAAPVLTGNTAAVNQANIATILAAAPAGSTIYSPGGTYNFQSKITAPAKQFTFQGQGSYLAGGYTIWAWTSNVADDLILLTNAIWGTQFRDMTFVSAGVTQTVGAVVNINGNAYTNFFNCTFSTTGGGFLFDVLKGDKIGSGITDQSWNSAIVSGCIMNGYKGRAIFVNSGASSLVVEKCVINGAWGGFSGAPAALQAVAGVEGRWVGALQVNACDILGNINNVLLDPVTANSEVCASVFVTNSYFDNSGGSCIKIAGTGATVRCRFDTCSFTTAGTNYSTPGTNLSAFEIGGTYAYPVGGQGIDIVNSNVQNTFGTTGTTNGFLITNGADFSIGNCKISPWTNGINVTPIATAGRTQCAINNNVIGPAGGFAGNVTGILLNAGAAAYGSMNIEGNILDGNTTAPCTDNSTIAVGATKKITGNVGYMPGLGALALNNSGGAAVINGRGAVTSGTGLTHLFGTRIPANSVPVGQVFKVTMTTQTSGAGALVINLTAGAAGATADTIVATLAATAVATGYQTYTGLVEIAALGASNTVAAQSALLNNTAVVNKTAAAEALSSVPTTAAWFLSMVASCSTGTLTVKGAVIEAL